MGVKKDIQQIFKHIDMLSEQYKYLEDRLNNTNSGVKYQDNIGQVHCEATLDQWEMLSGGDRYLCGFSTTSYLEAEHNALFDPLVFAGVRENYHSKEFVFYDQDKHPYDYCAIRRVYNEHQPWFGEGMLPINESECKYIVAKTRCGEIVTCHSIDELSWHWPATSKCDEDIIEFTLFK